MSTKAMEHIVCGECNRGFDIPVTREQITAWRGGMQIQHAMPNLSEDQRELFISGMCGKCFDALFEDSEK